MKKSDILMTLNAIGSRFYVDLIGRLAFSELLVLITIPFTSSYKKISQYYGLRTVIVCLLLMVFIQIISDVVNQSLFRDWTRGISVLLIAILSIFFFIDQLSKNINSIIYYLVGASIIYLLVGGSLVDIDFKFNPNYFKIRFVGFLNFFILLLSFYLYKNKKFKISILMFFVFSFLCFTFDARSNGLIFFISAFMLSLKFFKPNLNKFFFTSYLLVFFVILFGLYVVYVEQVLSNNFGGSHSISQINKTANPYNPIDLLYVGRIGVVVAGYAINEKPLLGHGSWAKDKNGKYAKISSQLRGGKVLDKSIIPAHSVIIGAWLNMGFFGFVIVMYLFYFFIKLFLKMYFKLNNSEYLPVIVALSIEMMWHFLFSPFGTIRTTFPIIVALLIVMNSQFIRKNYNLK